MRFPDFDLPLITTDEGAYPWGYGAIAVTRAPEGIHGCCGAKVRRHDGWHIFQDGAIACTKCAREFCLANYVPKPVEAPMGQQKLDAA